MTRAIEALGERLAGALARRWRERIAARFAAAGVEQVAIEGDAVRASGRGLRARWMDEARLREAGRGGT